MPLKEEMQFSREHHWWPAGLQEYWSVLGNLNSIDTSATTQNKKYRNRKIGKKSHGHTIARDSEHWRFNFEHLFQQADNSVKETVKNCLLLFPFSKLASILWTAFKTRLTRSLTIRDFSRTFKIDSKFRADLILICISLLIRSPANRHRLERAGSSFGFSPSEETGKFNMLSQVRLMNSAYQNGFMGNIFPLIIFSQNREFIFGDGLLDGMTNYTSMGQFRGHAIIPLTPHICIFLSCPNSVRSDRNARILFAPDWLVSSINEITQVYSRDILFFSTQKPKLASSFFLKEHRAFQYNQNPVVADLLEICGEPIKRNMFSL